MKVHSVGSSGVPVSSVPDGECFAFRRRGVTYIAIKLTGGQSVAILWPHHPNQGMDHIRAGLFSVSALDRFEVWLLSDAIACADTTPEQLRVKSEFRGNEIGSLVLAGTLTFVPIYHSDSGEIAWVNLGTGDLVRTLPDAYVWFPRWSIVLPDQDGVHRPICTIPEPESSGA